MKKLILLLAILFLGISNIHAQHLKKDGTPDRRYKENKTENYTPSNTNSEIIHVEGYEKKNGTEVKGYDRTAPNNTDKDNWSTKPNVNPETGKKGTKRPK